MPEQNIIEYITHGSEERNLEYKSSMSWKENATQVKVIKTAMAMANIPGGGVMVFGVDEIPSGHCKLSGMGPDDANSFNQDDVSEKVSEYVDPFVGLTVKKVEYTGKLFVVIQIQGFAELPVVCKKGGQGLVRGAIYTRPRRKVESVPVPSQTEMREILEMAVDKKIKKHWEDWFQWGLVKATPPEDIDAEKFKNQRGDL